MALHDAQALVGQLGGSAVVIQDGEVYGSARAVGAEAPAPSPAGAEDSAESLAFPPLTGDLAPESLPELVLTELGPADLPDFSGPAEPFGTEQELVDGIEAIYGAYGTWERTATARAYLAQDAVRRPEGEGEPVNAVVALREAYLAALRSPDDDPAEWQQRYGTVVAQTRALLPALADVADGLGESRRVLLDLEALRVLGDRTRDMVARTLATRAARQAGAEEIPAVEAPEQQIDGERAASEQASATRDTGPDAASGGEGLRALMDGFGDRIIVGHIGETSQELPQQGTVGGWLMTVLLDDEQKKALAEAVVTDNQPQPIGLAEWQPTQRVREWINAQQQAPSGFYFASTSADLPPMLRGRGDVHLNTRSDGLTMQQADRSALLRWEELPAWLDAAVEHYAHSGRGPHELRTDRRLDREVARAEPHTEALRNALDALDESLRATDMPTEEQLATARERYGPPPAAQPAAEVEAEAAEQRITETPLPQAATEGPPAEALPVSGTEGYHYVEDQRRLTLFGPTGEEVGTGRWSYVHYRFEGNVQGDTVRGTDSSETTVQRMANHHAAVYGDRIHRPELDGQGRDPVWIEHNERSTLVHGIDPEDATAAPRSTPLAASRTPAVSAPGT